MLKLLNQEMSQQLQQNLALQATLEEEDSEVEEVAEEDVALQEALNLLQEERDLREDVVLQEEREEREAREALQEVEDLPSDQELKEPISLQLPHRSNQSHQSKKKRDHHKTTLFVANLPFKMDDDQFAKVFKDAALAYKSAHVVKNQRSGRSKGFGFVEFENEQDQQKALAAVNKKVVDERELVVKVALAEQQKPAEATPEKQ
jgi:RNA recognition motif-containing protein